MPPTIRVDDDVYAKLQAEAEPFVDTPNSVLRRKLGLSADAITTATPANPAAPSRLATLLVEGLVEPGERLVWIRRNQGERHVAEIIAGGRIRLQDGSVHDSPSGAARHLTSYDVNGWKAWRRERDDRTLDDIWSTRRREVPRKTAPKETELNRNSRADRTPQKAFRPYILAVLRDAGGRQEIDKLLVELEHRMRHRLTPADYTTVDKGEPRWRNAARWERKDMVREGLLEPSDRSGVWQLTPAGKKPGPRRSVS